MFWKWSKKKEQVYHVGNEDVAVPEVHTGKVAHEQAAQQDTGEKENIHYENVAIPEVHIPQKEKVITPKQNRRRAARTAFMPARRRFFCFVITPMF